MPPPATAKPTPPFLPSLPLIGNALEFRRDRFGLIRRGLREKGPVFAIRLGPRPAAVLVGPEQHEIFFAQTDKGLRIDLAYVFLKAAFGETGLTAPPEIYQRHRPIFQAPFRTGQTDHFLAVMQEEIQLWLDTWGDRGELELTEPITRLTQRVAAHALMGRQFLEQLGVEFWTQYAVVAHSLDPLLPPHWPLPKFIRRDRARDRMRRILFPIVEERRKEHGQHDDFLQDFVDATYADGQPVEDEVILSMVMGMMFAGHETTAGQASWALLDLTQHPDHATRVREEVDARFPRATGLDSGVLKGLKHTQLAVLETARLHPSADVLLRVAVEDVDVGSHLVPKGWMVCVSPGVAHRLPEYFPEPDRYDPLRFDAGRAEDRKHRFALIGFGGGVHKCTGMNFALWEMTAIAAMVHQQYEIELTGPPPKSMVSTGLARPTRTTIRYRKRGA
jgi:sterol 14alpha-demethylase